MSSALRSGWVAPKAQTSLHLRTTISATATGIRDAAALSSGPLAAPGPGPSAVEPGNASTCRLHLRRDRVRHHLRRCQAGFLDCEKRETWNLDRTVGHDTADAAVRQPAGGHRDGRPLRSYLRLRPIIPLADEYGVPVIEDAAEALGAWHGFGDERRGRLLRERPEFSFNGNKIMTTSGGGMLVSRSGPRRACSPHLDSGLRSVPGTNTTEIGHNYRLSNLPGGAGRVRNCSGSPR